MCKAFAIAIVLALAYPRGAYALDRFVSRAGSDAGNDCTSALVPCATVAHALAAAAPSDAIKLAKATYRERVSLLASTTVTIEGGWSPTFLSRDPARYRTRLARVHIAAAAGQILDVTLDGLTIKDDPFAVRVEASGDGRARLLINGGVVERSPSGIEAFASDTGTLDVEVVDSSVSKNGGTGGVLGGVSVKGNDASTVMVRLIRSEVRSNGIHAVTVEGFDTAVVDVEVGESVVRTNRARGMTFRRVNATVRNVLIANNKGTRGAGLWAVDGAVVAVDNTTITGNRAVATNDEGAGILAEAGSDVSITNSIVWGNRGRNGLDDVRLYAGGGTVSAAFCDIGVVLNEGGTYIDGGGNIATDPLLRGSIPRPLPSSPVIDAGTCAGAPPTDIDGDPRPSGPGCDMGADEVVL
jgi:hypothetical protein